MKVSNIRVKPVPGLRGLFTMSFVIHADDEEWYPGKDLSYPEALYLQSRAAQAAAEALDPATNASGRSNEDASI